MPVPLPSAGSVNLHPPDAEETQLLADGVACAVAGHDGPLPVQRSLVEAMVSAMTGHPVSLEGRRPITAGEFAAALSRREIGRAHV